MTKRLLDIDDHFMLTAAKFFFVEYAKRAVKQCNWMQYREAQEAFKSLFVAYAKNCQGENVVKDCFSVFLKGIRNEWFKEEQNFTCPWSMMDYSESDACKRLECRNISMVLNYGKDKYNGSFEKTKKYINHYLDLSRPFYKKFRCADVDFYSSDKPCDFLLRWAKSYDLCSFKEPADWELKSLKHISSEDYYIKSSESKYAPFFEPVRKRVPAGLKERLISDPIPVYEDPRIGLRWFFKESKFSLEKISIQSKDIDNECNLISEVTRRAFRVINSRKRISLVRGLKGNSIIKRIVGLWMWDEVQLEGGKLDYVNDIIEDFFKNQKIGKYSREAMLAAYKQAYDLINNWEKIYGDIDQY